MAVQLQGLDMSRQIKHHYKLKREKLGSGAFSNVLLGVSKETNEKVAIKAIHLMTIIENKATIPKLQREIEIMKEIHDDHVVKLLDVFYGKKFLFLVMELCPGGDMNQYLNEIGRPLNETEARMFFTQVLDGTIYLHSHGIVHRDLKCENILLDETKQILKITDFGLANYVSPKDDNEESNSTINALLTTPCGTFTSIAPEVLKGEPYDERVDIWSLGTILYVFLSLTYPFSHPDQNSLIELIMRGELTFDEEDDIWIDVSDDVKFLIRMMINIDPVGRISLEQVKTHPWTRGVADPIKSTKSFLRRSAGGLTRSRSTIKLNVFSDSDIWE